MGGGETGALAICVTVETVSLAHHFFRKEFGSAAAGLKCYNTKAGKYREKRIVRATVRLSELLPVRTVLFPRGRIDL